MPVCQYVFGWLYAILRACFCWKTFFVILSVLLLASILQATGATYITINDYCGTRKQRTNERTTYFPFLLPHSLWRLKKWSKELELNTRWLDIEFFAFFSTSQETKYFIDLISNMNYDEVLTTINRQETHNSQMRAKLARRCSCTRGFF